jgi:hypothetical protein
MTDIATTHGATKMKVGKEYLSFQGARRTRCSCKYEYQGSKSHPVFHKHPDTNTVWSTHL